MKRFYTFPAAGRILLFFFLLITSAGVFGQTAGDYRSRNNGTWSDANDWERYNGTAWVANPSQGYPGQNSGTGNVLIQPGHAIDIEVSPANAIGSLTIGTTGANPTLSFNSATDRTLTVTGNVTVADGSFTVSNATGTNNHILNIGGNLSVSGGAVLSLNANRGNNDFCEVIFTGTNHTISSAGTISFDDLTFSNNGTVTVSNNINDIDGTMSVGATTTVQPAAAIQFNSGGAAGTISGTGTIQVTRTAVTADYDNQYRFNTNTTANLTIDYAGAGAQTVNNLTYGNLVTSGSGIKTIESDFTVNGNVTIGTGTTLTAPVGGSDDLTIGGNWINNGTFNGGDDFVIFNGGNQSITGNTTFFNLSKTTNTPETLTFAAGSTQTVTGTLTLTGTAGNLLTLASSTPPTQWNINPTGRNIDFVSVSNSVNTNGTPISATNSFNGGNNINWSFPVGVATQIALNAGNGQSVTAGTAVPVLPSVLVTDINGSPVSGLNVTFAVTGGGGSITGASAVTNGSGIATVGSWTLGNTAGTNTLTATRAGLTGSPVTFTATGLVGPLNNFLVEAAGGGNIPTQTANSSFNIRITARDAGGNTITSFNGAGNTVNITSTGTLSSGGGTTANFVNGVLTSHSVTISNPGSFTITATRTSGGSENGTSNTFTVNPGTKTSTGDTDWNLASTWSPSGVPTAGDAVIIRAGDIVTVNSTPSSSVFSITFNNTSNATSGLAFSNNAVLNVDGSITVQNDNNTNINAAISGSGTLNCASLQVGGTTTTLSSDQTTILTSTISNLNISGDLSIYGEDDGANDNDASFNLASGTVTVGGSVYTDEENGSVCTLSLNTGAETGKLVLAGSTPFDDQVGTLSFDAAGANATVEYAGAAQTVRSVTYTNLTLSGTGSKTFATGTTTVNGVHSIENGSFANTFAGSLAYGTAAALQYNAGSSNRTASNSEWPGTFSGTGGVLIKGTGTITLAGGKQLGNNNNAPLNINTGATLNTNNNSLTFHGDFINDGTFTAGNSAITFAGTTATQSIDGFTTTGTVSMTKTGGTATLQGAVSGNALTINGSGGTLNLGTSLTHTFTGTWTRTNGTLNGGSSTLQLGAGFSGTGGTFTANTGTVEWNANGPQTIAGVTYYNLILSGSGTKTLTGLSAITNDFTLSGTASATAPGALNIDGDVTIGLGTTFNASSFTHLVAGNWINNGTFTAGTSTVNFDGTTQSIGGSNSTTFNNLNLTNSGTKTFGIAQDIDGALNIATGVVLNLGTFTSNANSLVMGGVDRASGSWGSTSSPATWTNNTFFAATTGIINIATCTGGLWTGAIDNDWFNAGNWCGGLPTASTNVVVNPGGNQPSINAAGALSNNLTVNSGASLTLGAAGGLSISGAFTNSGTFNANATSTINYAQASGTQNILAANYGNLTLSGGITKTFPTGTVGIAGIFSPGSFTTATQGTIDFNGSSSQTIPAFNYFNLTSSNSGARTLTSSGTIGIAGAFTPGTNAYTNTGSTISFNGITQTVPAFTYYNLTRAGTGTNVASFAGSTTIQGNLTMSAGTLRVNNNGNIITVEGNYIHNNGAFEVYSDIIATSVTGTLNIAGNFTMANGTLRANENGIFSAAIMNVNFNGSTTQTFNKTGGTISVNSSNNQATNNFTINSSAIVDFGTSVLDGAGNFTNNGTIITKNINGLHFNGSSGTIQLTDTRVFSTSGNYVYNGTSAQTTGPGLTGANNLTISNAAGVSQTSSSVIVTGTLTLAAGAFDISGRTLQFHTGNIPIDRTGASSITTNGTTTLQFGSAGNLGGVPFTLPSGVFTNTPAVVGNLIVNRTNPVTLGSQDITVNTALTLTSGILASGSNNIIIPIGGTVNRTSGHVNGNLRKFVAVGANPVIDFEIGDASVYTPLQISVTGTVSAGTGSLTAKSNAGDHPNLGSSGINSTVSVNRYWTLTNNTSIPGLTSYSAEFNYAAGDNDGGTTPANYKIRLYNGSTWANSTVLGTPTNTTATATALTAFGDFAIGESTGTIAVSQQPVDAIVCNGSGNTSFTSASASTPAPSIKWQRDDGTSGFIDITAATDGGIYSGFTTGTLILTGATTSQNGYQYRAVFSNINGTVDSDPASLSVLNNLTPTVNLSGSNGGNPVCAGSSITLTANAGSISGGTVNYQFFKNSVEVQNSSSNTYLATSLANGDAFTCTITVTGGNCLATNTASSNTVTITANPIITPSVTISSSAGNTICDGSNVTFTASISNTGGGTVNYQFLKNSIQVQNGASNSYLASSIVNGDVFSCVITVTGGACLSSPTAASNNITITVVNPNITPSVTISASTPTTVCNGTSVTFTAVASGTAGGNVTYDFRINGSTVQNGASNTYTTSTLSNGNNVSCIISVGGGTCVTTTATSNTINMSVTPLPTVSIAQAPIGDLCAGTSVTFTATASNPGGGTFTYNFKVNGTTVQSSSSNVFTTNSYVNGDAVTCEIVLNGGTCNGAVATSNTRTLSVVTTLTPTLSLAAFPSATVCNGGNVQFTATAANTSGGTVTYTFKVNGGTVQTGSSNIYNSTTLNNGDAVNCSIVVAGLSCGTPTANSNTINITTTSSSFVWTGLSNTVWSNASNWNAACGVPPAGSNVIIPTGAPRYPVINAGTISTGNITIQTGASVIVNGTGTLQVAGAITNNGTLNATAGTIEFNGSSTQTVNGNVFSTSTVKNVKISNNVTLSGTLNVTTSVSFGAVNNKQLSSAGFLVLKSTPAGTASLDDITNSNTSFGNTVTGKVIVERYIPSGRKWRGLSAPFIGSTNNSVFDNWQNGGIEIPFTGALLWSPTGTGVSGNGFSLNSNPGASQNLLGYSVNSFTQPASTKTAPLFTANGPVPYLVFVTDRYLSGDNTGRMKETSGANATTLKASGTLLTGNYSINSMAAGFRMIPNPYPAPLEFATIGKTNINNQFWVWDPRLFGFSGYGGYVYTSNSGSGYISVPLGGSYNANSSIIPSGGAFWVSVNDGFIGSLSFQETDKATGGFSLFGARANNGSDEILRVNLTNPAGDQTFDGIAGVYNNSSSAIVDRSDVQKFGIGSENISVRRMNKDLAIEFRPLISEKDTLFLRLHNMKQQQYRLDFTGENFEASTNLTAVLQDLFLNTETPLNIYGNQVYNFTVTSSSASTGDRFRVVFRPSVVTPVRDITGELKGISIYPSPLVRGAAVQVSFTNMKAGKYELRLYDILGVQVAKRVLTHSGGTALQTFDLPGGLAAGMYIAEIVNDKGVHEKIKVTVQ